MNSKCWVILHAFLSCVDFFRITLNFGGHLKVHLTNPIFILGREIAKNYAYMKFGRNKLTNDLIIVSKSANQKVAVILALISLLRKKNPLSYLGEKLLKVLHI